uniref:Glucose-6-phosphatase n=1 Tax=Clastoptera arizonana TaxID=38151 RepID=A0A1B6E689_9HEMI
MSVLSVGYLINLYEAIFIHKFQNLVVDYDSFFLAITKVSDPAYAISILFPVAASVNTSLGADILVTTIVAEWINTLLKWVLREDRPYWWVHEYQVPGSPDLLQTPLTCETGPGSPSGHVMGFAALLFAVLHWISHTFINTNTNLKKNQKKTRIYIIWAVVLVMLLFVSLSRIYIGAHFPHQCILGAIFGLAIGYWLTDTGKWCIREWWRSSGRFKLLCVSSSVMLISIASYLIQIYFGIDPQWSVKLAFKWCQNPEFVHVSTTPLFSLVRVSGALFGLACASPIKKRTVLKFYPVVGVTLVVILVISLQMFKELIPTHDVVAFYFCQFSLYVALSFLLLFVVPNIAHLVKMKEA